MPLPADPGSAGERFAREVDFARRARPAFSGQDRAQAELEAYELADRIVAYRSAADPAIRGAQRDRVLRQVRQLVPALEELLADDGAAAQLRDAARTLPPSEVDLAAADRDRGAPGTQAAGPRGGAPVS
jgi:hypothetical protein